MNWMEAALLVLGIGAFVASFCLPEKNKKEENFAGSIDPEVIRNLINKEMEDAKTKVTEVVDETLEYAVEKTERASERISNEKIMAINEYSETVLADMNKTHQEIMFLYDMLNDKHKNLKETVQQVDKTAKEAEEKANAAATALAATSAEEPKAEKKTQEPVKTPAKKSKTSKPAQEKRKDKDQHITLDMLESVLPKEQLAQLEIKEDKKKNEPEQFQALQPDKLPEIKEFSFDKILRLHKQGMSSVDIAKELGLGVGEVKLVINLFKGA